MMIVRVCEAEDGTPRVPVADARSNGVDAIATDGVESALFHEGNVIDRGDPGNEMGKGLGCDPELSSVLQKLIR